MIIVLMMFTIVITFVYYLFRAGKDLRNMEEEITHLEMSLNRLRQDYRKVLKENDDLKKTVKPKRRAKKDE